MLSCKERSAGVAALLHLPGDMDLDSSLQPHGYRLLSKIPRLVEMFLGL